MVEVRELGLPGVLEIRPRKFGDSRGFFSETWSVRGFAAVGLDLDFVQDNHSYSPEVGTLRGLHFQVPPFAQDKLVRVVRGAIFDVAVDIRMGSPTFGNWTGVRISAEAWNQILVPKGFAHGFVTTEPDTEVVYKVTAAYAPDCDRSIRYDDPAIGIEWPTAAMATVRISDKDRLAPLLGDVETGFQIQ